MAKGDIGTSAGVWYSFKARKRFAKARKRENTRWKSLNGPVKTRKATEEELKNFKKPP